MGLLSREKTLETENSVPFNDRRSDQNAARVNALPQSEGGAENLSSGLRNVFSNLDDIENGKLSTATSQAQDAATDLGGHQSADYYGRQIQGAAQPSVDAAQGQVRGALDAIGGTDTPETYGAGMRGAEASGAAAAKAHRTALYRAIDPDGSLQAVNTPVKTAAQGLADNLPKAAAPPSGEEAAIMAHIKQMPDVAPFSEFQALDSRITAAGKAERMSAGESPSYARLMQLKSGVQDAMTNAAEHQHAYEQQQIAAQMMPPELSMQSRLADLYGHEHADYVGGAATGTDGPLFPGARRLPNGPQQPSSDLFAQPPVPQAPQHLIGFARAMGGLKDEGGDLASAGLGQRYPGLINNKSGVPLDRAREAAAEQGYLGADTDHAVGNTDVNDFIDALHNHPTYSVRDQDVALSRDSALTQRDLVGRYKQAAGDLKQGLAGAGIDPRSAHPEMVHDASQLMVHQSLPWHEALEKAGENRLADLQDNAREANFRASQEAGYQHPSLGDAGEGPGQGAAPSEPSGALGPDGEARPTLDQAAVDRLNVAKRAHAAYAQTFKQGDTAKRLKTNGFAGQYQLSDAGVPNTVFTHGKEGAQKLQTFFDAAGNTPETQGLVRNYAAMSLRRAAVRGDGSFDPAAYQRWTAQHQDALRALPGGQQQFANVNAAQEALSRFHPFTQGASPSSIPEMFFHSGESGADGVANLRSAIGDQAATSQITDYAASKLRQHALNADGTLDPRRVASFVKAHDPALSALPGLKDRFSTAAKASETINDVARQRKQALDAFQRESVGKIMGSSEPADITRMVGDVFGKANGVAQMKDLAGKAAQAGPDAIEGLRKAAVDHVMGKFISNRESGTSGVNKIAGNSFQTFVKQKSPVLSQIFTPEEVKNMQAVSDDIAQANRSIDAVHVPGQSQTAALRHKVASAEGHGGGESLLQKFYFLSHGVHELAHQVHKIPFVGEALGDVIGHAGLPIVAAKKLLNSMQARGITKVDELEREAMLNPHVARDLMRKVTPHNAAPLAERLATRLSTMTPFYASQQYQGQATPARAAGGRVEPTDAQKEAGNYAKDHTRFAGLGITIENKKGSARSGIGGDGKRWSVDLPADYGYIKGTEGADGDHVDCYIGPDDDAPYAWVINQMDLHPRRFDEHKVMLGFRSRADAVETYKRGFSDGKGAQRIGSVRTIPMSVFPKWVKSSATKKVA